MKTGREQVLDIVIEVLENGKQSKTVLHQVLDMEVKIESAKPIHWKNATHSSLHKNELSLEEIDHIENSYIKRASYGVIERAIELDAIINQFSKINTKKMKPIIRNGIRLGVYEMKYMDNIPISATCNEIVGIVGKRGFKGLKGFVNGVLRNIARNMEAKIILTDISCKYSMPKWIVSLLREQYNEATIIKMLESFLKEKSITIRVNEEKTTVSDYLINILTAGYVASEGNYIKEALILEGAGNVEMLPGFKEGYFVVQDESAMLPVKCAGIKKGQTVLDICAAPGGKTMQAAEYVGVNGKVYARDLTKYKCKIIENNAKRLGLYNIDIQCKDARELEKELIGQMDVVIADVPCSGIGIIGRKPDIKYHITEKMIDELVTLQQNILDVAVKYVKVGGLLMYSTCTINRAENEDNVAYLEKKYSFHTESMKEYLTEELQLLENGTGMLQMIPGVVKSDGFFVAKLRRVM